MGIKPESRDVAGCLFFWQSTRGRCGWIHWSQLIINSYQGTEVTKFEFFDQRDVEQRKKRASIIQGHLLIYQGNPIPREKVSRPKRSPPKPLVSPFDEEEQYELTELGQQFIHYAMTDLPIRIEYTNSATLTKRCIGQAKASAFLCESLRAIFAQKSRYFCRPRSLALW